MSSPAVAPSAGAPSKKPKPARSRRQSTARWVVIASFVDANGLSMSLQELALRGYEANRLCLVAEEKTVNALHDLDPSSPINPLVRRVSSVSLEDGFAACATSGRFDSSRRKNWPGVQLLYGLGERVESGSILLLVQVSDAADIVGVTRTLLNRSSHHVQTREIGA